MDTLPSFSYTIIVFEKFVFNVQFSLTANNVTISNDSMYYAKGESVRSLIDFNEGCRKISKDFHPVLVTLPLPEEDDESIRIKAWLSGKKIELGD